MSTSLFKRTAIAEISKYLHTDEIVVIHGARQVGKTSILMYLQEGLASAGERTYYLDLEDSRFVSTLDKGVDEFVTYLGEQGFDLSAFKKAGRKLFVLIDEIQYLANPSSLYKMVFETGVSCDTWASQRSLTAEEPEQFCLLAGSVLPITSGKVC